MFQKCEIAHSSMTMPNLYADYRNVILFSMHVQFRCSSSVNKLVLCVIKNPKYSESLVLNRANALENLAAYEH